jgi:hypothetical protein
MDCERAEIAPYMATTNSQDQQPGRIPMEKLKAPEAQKPGVNLHA